MWPFSTHVGSRDLFTTKKKFGWQAMIFSMYECRFGKLLRVEEGVATPQSEIVLCGKWG